jgi:hypothetical protein
MGNGHAPGTATGRGMAGAGVAVTDFGTSRRWTAGLAVFFFAALLIAGFLAGFFLAGREPTVLLAAFLFLPTNLRATGFRAAARFADLGVDFFLAAFFLIAFFAVFFPAFFTFAMIASDCEYG